MRTIFQAPTTLMDYPMEKATRNDLNQAGIDFVAAQIVLRDRRNRSETVIELARKLHDQACTLLQHNGFAPHLADGLDVLKNGNLCDVKIHGASGVQPIEVSGIKAAQISAILYPG